MIRSTGYYDPEIWKKAFTIDGYNLFFYGSVCLISKKILFAL